MPSISWQPWHTAAFLDAQRRRVPVLLLLETAWAPACAEAHATVFSRADVQEVIAASTIAVRVDADRRPDIADRYGLGRWPSVLVLTPEGLLLTGGTQLDETFGARLRGVVDAFRSHDGDWSPTPSTRPDQDPATRSRDLRVPGASDPDDLAAFAALADAIWHTRDQATGAFVHEHVPSPQAVLFAFAHAAATGDTTWLDAAFDTLEAFEGLRRTRVTRLEEQAEWMGVLARAYQIDGDARRLARLEALLTSLEATFRRRDGHWRPWSGNASLVLVDASARACRAVLAAADVAGRPDLARTAIDSLELLAPLAYARAAGVAHVIEDGRARGPMLLDDAMLLAHALLDADVWRDDDVYRDLADELLRTTLARLQRHDGALEDRVAALAGAGRVGRLADPHHPLVGNAAAACLLRRLRPDDAEASDAARRILCAVTPRAVQAGVFGAPVARAWHALRPAGLVTAVW